MLQISSYWQAQAYDRAQSGSDQEPVRLDLLPGVDAERWLLDHAGDIGARSVRERVSADDGKISVQ